MKSFDRLTTQSEVEGPQEYYLYFEDFEPKPDKEFGRKPKFCKGLRSRPVSLTTAGIGRFMWPRSARSAIITRWCSVMADGWNSP